MNLRESLNSHKNKAILFASILLSTSGMLTQNLSAQTPNNSKPKMEQIDKNDAQRVTNFMKPLNITIPAEWITFASDNIQMLDAEGIASAQMILQQDLTKVDPADKVAYVLMAFDAIHTAYDKEEHTKASDEFFAEYITYENLVKSVTNRFAQDRQKRSEIYIAQTQEETNQINIKANQKAKESEEGLLKLFKINPNDTKLKTLAQNTKKLFDEYDYKYSSQTEELFKKLGIK